MFRHLSQSVCSTLRCHLPLSTIIIRSFPFKHSKYNYVSYSCLRPTSLALKKRINPSLILFSSIIENAGTFEISRLHMGGFNKKCLHVIYVFGRFLFLSTLFTPLAITFPIAYHFDKHFNSTFMNLEWWYSFLTWTIDQAGPAFIKLAQWASTRTDIFPPNFCSTLSALQSNVSPHSFEHTKAAIESSFGRKWEEIFESLETDPVGVGAISQVHKGILKDPLRQHCAVKVIHPHVHFLIPLDVTIILMAAQLLHCIPNMEWISLPQEAAHFSSLIFSQLDLTTEAANLEVFRSHFAQHWNIDFPIPIYPFVSHRVLVETFVEGVPLKSAMQWDNEQFKKELAESGLHSFLVNQSPLAYLSLFLIVFFSICLL